MAQPKKPNILVIWGDDIGITNLSCYSDGLMGTARPTSIVWQRRASASLTITENRAVRLVGLRSLPAKAPFAPG